MTALYSVAFVVPALQEIFLQPPIANRSAQLQGRGDFCQELLARVD